MNTAQDDQSKWPTIAILGYGTLGASTLAGRRYHRRSTLALVLLVAWMALATSFLSPTMNAITAAVPGLAFLYIVFEFRRYLLALDELARRLHMEALAWTYLTGLALAMLVGGISSRLGWQVNPMWFVLLEPIRAAFLYFGSRRY